MTKIRNCIDKRGHIDIVECNSVTKSNVAMNNMSLLLFGRRKSKNYIHIWKKDWNNFTKKLEIL